MDHTDDVKKSWEKFLHPASLQGNIITIALFIAAFEVFKDQVIEKPKILFSTGFDENGLTVGKDYENEVLSKSKYAISASLLWFKEKGAIDDNDIELFHSIRKHRNQITHEMMAYLANASKEVDIDKFKEMIMLLLKIERWWLIYFEAAIDPDLLPEGADINEIVPGSIWAIQLMMDILMGKEPEEGYYFKEFVKRFP